MKNLGLLLNSDIQDTFNDKCYPTGSILNALAGKYSKDTWKKGKGTKAAASHDWQNFYLSQYDWLKGSHMTKVVWLPNKTDYSYCEIVAPNTPYLFFMFLWCVNDMVCCILYASLYAIWHGWFLLSSYNTMPSLIWLSRSAQLSEYTSHKL